MYHEFITKEYPVCGMEEKKMKQMHDACEPSSDPEWLISSIARDKGIMINSFRMNSENHLRILTELHTQINMQLRCFCIFQKQKKLFYFIISNIALLLISPPE